MRKRDVWNLKRQRDNYSSSIITFNDDFKLETSGYWKSLKPNEIGQNKNGDEIHGKTWVSITKTWHETENKPIKITNNIKTLVNSVNSGFIYIMRNASHEKNIFKVGLTRRDCETRAKELSSATGVPDKYLIVEEFATADCVLAEKLIHEKLDDYRLNNKREFFKANYSFIRATINEIVNEINSNT
ncbi:GIY-YIG nuclease family protein [Bacteroides fragilis]